MKKAITLCTAVLILTASWLYEPAQAGIIIQNQANGGVQILYASPTGQTFTAEDEHIKSIGFMLQDTNPTGPPIGVTIELFRGEGIGGQSLGSAPVEGLYPGFNGFFDANFDFVSLQVGDIYTAIVSSSSERAHIWFNQVAFENGQPFFGHDYTGGTFIAGGQIISYQDAAFRVIPVPEPATLLLLGLGGLMLRKRIQK